MHSTATSSSAFARRFRLLMSYHDFTLRDIADATGNAISTVGCWKNGRMPSEVQMLQKLADVFQVSVEYLVEGRDSVQTGSPRQREADDAAGRILDDLAILQSALESESRRREAPAPAVKERKRCGHSQA